MLLNRATREQADKVWPALFERYPTPEAMSEARPVDLARRFRRLGLHRRRARAVIALSAGYAFLTEELLRSDESMAWLATLRGVGKYAADSFAIFVLGRTDVEPDDPELAAYLAEAR